MEANEIMTNEEVMETTTEEIVKASSASGFKTAAVFGLVFIAGYVAMQDDFDDFEEAAIVSGESVGNPE